MERSTFRRDDSGHWYLIPQSFAETFDTLMDEYYDCDEEELMDLEVEFERLFSAHRIDNVESYSFTDPIADY